MPRAHKTSWYRDHPLLPFQEYKRSTIPCQLCGREFATGQHNRSLCTCCAPKKKRLSLFWNARKSARLYAERDLPYALTDTDKVQIGRLSAILFTYVVLEEDLYILRKVAERIRPTVKIGGREIDRLIRALNSSRVPEAAKNLLYCAIRYQRAANNVDEMFQIEEALPTESTPDTWYEDVDDQMDKYLRRLFNK